MDSQIQHIDSIYKRMNDDIEEEPKEKPASEIQPFFSGKTIFLTGCTGFVGKCLVEKLLRTCPDINRLYILVRPKKGKTSEQRIEEYFDNVLFQPLRTVRPDFYKKVTIINGDLSMPGINLSPENRQLLIETVDLIIHNAAMVYFEVKLSRILQVNVLGTKEMLDLAAEFHHLKAFLYISTAYSNCHLTKTIEEKFYTPPADLQVVRDMIKADSENEAGLSEEVSKSILGPCPNAYVFTKAIAENIVQEYARKVPFPCGVFRMSMVISTYKEPLRGWVGNMNGPTNTFLRCGLAMQHVIYVAENGAPDIIPADMTANACWVALWDLAVNKKDRREASIYNYGSSSENPITYKAMRDRIEKYGVECPSQRTAALYFVIITHRYLEFLFYHILFHYFPAFVMDLIRLLQRKKPKFVPFIFAVEKHLKLVLYFSLNNWDIKVGELIKIWDRLNPTDQELFFSDVRKLDWEEFTSKYWHGMRVYLLKEPMDNIVYARRRYDIVRAISYVFIALLLAFFFYAMYRTFCPYAV